jgi:hypothetical protein
MECPLADDQEIRTIICSEKQVYFNTSNAMSETLDFIDVRTTIFGGVY